MLYDFDTLSQLLANINPLLSSFLRHFIGFWLFLSWYNDCGLRRVENSFKHNVSNLCIRY